MIMIEDGQGPQVHCLQNAKLDQIIIVLLWPSESTVMVLLQYCKTPRPRPAPLPTVAQVTSRRIREC
jgi:hypothetical protein